MGAATKSVLQWEQGVQIGRDSVTELRSGCSNNNSHSSCDSRRLSQLLSSRTRRRPAQRFLSFPRSRLVTALLVRCHERFFPLSPISVRLAARRVLGTTPVGFCSLRPVRVSPAQPVWARYPRWRRWKFSLPCLGPEDARRCPREKTPPPRLIILRRLLLSQA